MSFSISKFHYATLLGALFSLVCALPGCLRTEYPECNDPLVTIIESPNIQSVDCYLQHVKDPRHTLILFDIDNTLVEPETELGSDQWFYAMVEKNKKAGMEKNDAVEAVVPVFTCLQRHINLKLTEPIIPAYFEKLKKQGFMVAALTARSCSLADITIQGLRNIGITFSDDTNIAVGVSFAEMPSPACYKAGILFCSSNTKGEVLLSLFKRLDYRPERVILIDDKFYNILSVQNSLENEHIRFVGVRYSRLDTKIQQFSLERTAGELEQFCIQHPEVNTPESIPQNTTPLNNSNQGAL